jgi:PilZ domain-containing protein
MPDPPSDGSNRRQARRARVLLGGIVVSRDGGRTWNCSIKDLSETGAKIQVADSQVIPERAYFINLKSGIAYEVQTAWLRLPLAGLKFGQSFPLEGLPDPKLGFLRRLWTERRNR